MILWVSSSARAQGDAPADKEIAAAIARGVAFLKESQSHEGHWDEPSQRNHRLGMTALAGLALLENGVARDAARDQQGPRDRRGAGPSVRSDLRHRAGDPVPGAVPARAAGRGRRVDPDLGAAAGGRRSRRESGTTRCLAARTRQRRHRPIAPRPGPRRPPAGSPFFPGQGDNSNTQFALLGLWAAGRHGFDSDEALESIDRPLPVVAAPRWSLGLSAGHARVGGDVVRGPDGAGDRRVAAEPGRAADGPARGQPWPPTRRFKRP